MGGTPKPIFNFLLLVIGIGAAFLFVTGGYKKVEQALANNPNNLLPAGLSLGGMLLEVGVAVGGLVLIESVDTNAANLYMIILILGVMFAQRDGLAKFAQTLS